MKKRTKFHVIMLIFTFVLVLFAALTTLISAQISGNNKSNETVKQYRDDVYYAGLMDDKVDSDYLIFDPRLDPVTNTRYAVLTGFNVNDAITYALSYQSSLNINIDSSDPNKNYKAAAVMFSRFLDIPDTYQITQGSTPVNIPVTEIDFDSFYASVDADESSRTVASFMTGIRIPKSVKKISENAFHAFGSIQYFESPFIGTERGSSATYLNWNINGKPVGEPNESYPFVKMFSKQGMGAIVGYKYVKDSDNKIEIDFSSADPQYSVQCAEADWYEVVQLNTQSYEYPGDLTKIVITDEHSVGNHALFNLNAVTDISISADSDYLADGNPFRFGKYAISNCANLVNVELPISTNVDLTYAEGLFQQDQELLEVRLPGNLTIPDSIFAQCTKLHTVHIPSSIQEIGILAFKDCQELKNFEIYSVVNYNGENNSIQYTDGEVHLPSSIKKIGREAFTNCYRFKKVYINNNLEFMGYSAFSGCGSIEEMSIPFVGAHRGNAHAYSQYLSSTDDGYKYFGNFGYIFGTASSVGCKEVTQANPDGSQTFYIPECLKVLTISDETQISTGAFQNMTMLTDLTINSGVTYITQAATSGCSNIERLSIPFAGVTEGSGSAVGTIYGVANANLPSKLKSITLTHAYTVYSGSFHHCKHITSVTFSNYTTWTQSNIFYDTPFLKYLTIPFVGTHRGYFRDTYCHSYYGHVTVDGKSVGYQWWWWRDINIRDSFMWIFSTSESQDTTRNYSQYYSYYPYTYTRFIPNSLTNLTITNDWGISGLAFENLTHITNLNIASASHIDEGALKGMSNLTELHIPYLGYDANSTGVDGSARVLGYIFGNYDNSLTYTHESSYGFNVPKKLKTVSITGTISAIPSYAFYNLPTLQSVTLNENSIITRLGSYAFAYDTQLNTVTIPNATYDTVGAYAFYNCKNIIDVNAVTPFSQLKTIGNYAFAGTGVGGSAYDDNGELRNYTIDFKNSSLTSIGAHAFENCVNIKSIELKTNCTVGDYAFAGCDQLSSVKVANSISKYMFKNCYSITEIDIRNFDVIPDGIFYGCENLLYSYANSAGLKYSENTKSIGAYAFYGCESFTKFILYPATTSIGQYAFAGCTGLVNMTIPRETKNLLGHGWDNCDDNFYFWVYEVEEDWPTTWVDNWNCGFPVYVIGQTLESDFVYEYSIAHKGYFINGVTEGVVLEGRVKFPTRFQGLPILGIKYDLNAQYDENNVKRFNLIKDQVNITSVIIPEQYYYIEPGAFVTGHRVDVYFEASRTKILEYYNDDSIVDFQKAWEPTDIWEYDDIADEWNPQAAGAEADFVSYGLIFYGESWEYGKTKATATIPYYKASKLAFKYIFEDSDISYTGSQIKPTSVERIFMIEAVLTGNDSLGDDMYKYASIINEDVQSFIIDNSIDLDLEKLFDYSYKNNVLAGNNATVTATANSALFSDYLSILDMMSNENYQNEKNKDWNRVYVTGANTYKFSIAKKAISLYVEYEENLMKNHYEEYEYTGSAWSNSTWDSTNVTGLFGEFKSTYPNQTKLEATLATTGVNVGIYTASYQTIAQTPDFKWSVQPKIYRDKVDITSNFDFYLFLTVKIVPKKVTVKWTGYANQEENPKELNGDIYYEYRYNGSAIVKPSAVPVYYDSVLGEVTESEIEASQCKIVTVNISENDPLLDRFPSADLHRCIAYLDPQKNIYGNYLLVDANGYPYELDENEIQIYPDTEITMRKRQDDDEYYQGNYYYGLEINFMIIKGLIKIEHEEDYVIPSNVDLWEHTFTQVDASVSGVGKDSQFKMKFATIDDELGLHSYQGNSVEIVQTNSVVTGSEFKDYHIYRTLPNGSIIDEIKYYEEPSITILVNILYDDFTITFYVSQYNPEFVPIAKIGNIIAGTTEPITPVTSSTSDDAEHTENYGFIYYVEGHWYIFHIGTEEYEENPDNLIDYSLSYLTDDGQTHDGDGQLFRMADQTYHFGAQVSARHFNLKPIVIDLETKKSNVIIDEANCNKVYDRTAYDIADYILKYDTYYYEEGKGYDTQKDAIQASAKYYRQDDPLTTTINESLEEIDAPLEVGSYLVSIIIPHTRFFNGYGDGETDRKIIPFQITRRTITIDLTGAIDEFDQTILSKDFDGVIMGYKRFDGDYQVFTPNTDKLLALGYLLPEVLTDENTVLFYKDEFVGELSTTGYKPGVYDATKVKWTTAFHIYSEDGKDNTGNYTFEIVGSFKIVPLTFTQSDGETEGIEAHEYYDNTPLQDPNREYHINHGAIVFDGDVHYPYVIANPAPGRTDEVKIYYSLKPLTAANYTTGSLVPYYNNEPTDGLVTIYYYVYCENYEPMSGDLKFEILRRRIQLDLPGEFNVINNTWEYIVEYEDGDTQFFEINVIEPTYGTVVEYSYSKDLGQTWSPWDIQAPYIADSEGLLYVKYRVTDESNHYYTEYSYNTIQEADMSYIIFQVKEPNIRIQDEYTMTITNYTGVYDGEYHQPTVTIVPKTGVTDKSGSLKISYTLNYVQGEANDWIDGLPSEKDAGTYNYTLRLYVPGYKTYITDHTTVSSNEKFGIVISKRGMVGLDISTYSGKYDGEYHALEVINASSYPTTIISKTEEDIFDYDTNTETHVVKYFYNDPTLGDLPEEITFEYTSNLYVVASNSGWLSELSYKDAGKYRFYIKVSSKNYEDLILGKGADGLLYNPKTITGIQTSTTDDDSFVEILKLTADEIVVEYEFTEFEYTKFNSNDFKITTIHDGRRRYYYWETIYDENTQTYSPNFEKRIGEPKELGRYVLMVQFLETKNCEAFTIGIDNDSDLTKVLYFDIIPMTVTVNWTDTYYYDGAAYSPNVYPTPDVVTIGISAKDNGPIERSAVGSYDYYVFIDPADEHYVLDKDEITMNIVKRQIKLTIEDQKEIDGKIYHRSNDPDIDYDNSDIEYKAWDQPLTLLSGDGVKHELILTIKTSTYVRDTYKTLNAQSGLSTRYATLEWKIVALDPVWVLGNGTTYKDENGDEVKVTQTVVDGKKIWVDPNGDEIVDEDGNAIKFYQKKVNGKLQWEYRRDALGNLDESPSDYYDVDISAIIKIVYPSINISAIVSDVVPYDGYEHTLPLFTGEKPAALANADIFLYDDNGEPLSNPPKYTNAGTYTYHILVKKNGYEDTKADVTLTIELANLNPVISYPAGDDAVYDGTGHTISYELYSTREYGIGWTALNPEVRSKFELDHQGDATYYHVRYYKKSEITEKEIKSIYQNFSITNKLYEKYAYESMVDAGEYYVVVYYSAVSNQWKKCVYIDEVTIYPRPLGVTFNEPIFKTKEYDGKKLTILLSGLTQNGDPLVTIQTSDLVYGHSIDTSQTAMMNYIIQTKSADAGTYGVTDFEFKHIVILDDNDQEVPFTNYQPYVYGNVDVVITKAYLTELNYKVSDNTETYSGDPVSPIIYCESTGEKTFRYYEIDEDGNILVDEDGNIVGAIVVNNNGDTSPFPGLPINAGRYRVLVDVAAGKNHYSSDTYNPSKGAAIGTQEAIVTILQAEVTIVWKDLTVEFNFETQTAKATITSLNNTTYNLKVFYYDENNEKVDGFVNVGDYLAYATFDDDSTEYSSVAMNKNFKLTNDMAYFTITPITLTINIGTETVYLSGGTNWSKTITIDDISNFPSDYLTLVAKNDANPYIRTKKALAGSYNSIDNFSLEFYLKLKSTGEDVTNSINFVINGKITVKYNEIPHIVKNQSKVYKGTQYLALQDLKVLTVSLPAYVTATYLYSYTVERADGTQYRSPNFNDDFGLTDVGTYIISYTITPNGQGYEITTGTVEVEIYAADANVPVTGSLNKQYNGQPVNPKSIVSQTAESFNGTPSEFIYDFYERTTEGLQYVSSYNPDSVESSSPVDAGEYRLVITSKEDKVNQFGYFNYTKLNIGYDFTISPMTLTLNINDSVTITASDLNGQWSSGTVILKSTAGTGLKSGDYLAYEYSIGNVNRSKYAADMVFSPTETTLRSSSGSYIGPDGNEVLNAYTYNPLEDPTDTNLADDDKKVSPTYHVTNIQSTRSDQVDSDNVWSFRWVVYDISSPTSLDANDKIVDGYEDISRNYAIQLDFDVYIHYKLIEGYEFNSISTECNGDDYNGSVTIASNISTDMLSTTKKFALNPAYFDDPLHASEVVDLTTELSQTSVIGTTYQLNNSLLRFSTPGVHYVYYQFLKDDTFEPLTGYFTVTINKVNMPITVSDTSVFDYNGYAKYTKDLNGVDFIPNLIIGNNTATPLTSSGNISYTIGSTTINDTIAINNITIKYYKGADEIDSQVGAITAGDYTYTIVIPETSNFYKRTITGSFSITRGVIKIVNRNTDNPYTGTYSSSQLSYSNFAKENQYYLVKIRTDIQSSTFANLGDVTTSYEIRGTLVTDSMNAGTYIGGANLNWVLPTEPTIIINGVNQTENYRVDISEASMVIAKNTITVFDVTPEYTYDEEYHGVKLTITGVTNKFIFYYDEANLEWVYSGDDDLKPVPSFKFKDVGTYQVKYMVTDAYDAADRNFDPFIDTATVVINLTTPYVRILDDFNKDYDGQEVIIPTNFDTNSTATDIKTYTILYDKYDKDNDTYVHMSTYRYGDTGLYDDNNEKIYGWIVIDSGDVVTRPINAGKYRMKVIIPQNGNYAEAESDWKEFEISPLAIQAIWGNPNKLESDIKYDYDGNPHMPTAYVRMTNGNLVKLKVTAAPKTSNASNDLSFAGGYLATASLDEATAYSADQHSVSLDSIDYATFSNNYYLQPSTLLKNYSILAKKVIISVNQEVTYTGAVHDFTLATRDQDGNYITEPHTFKATGLLMTHSVVGALRLNKVTVRTSSNPYTKFNDDFFWWRNSTLQSGIKITDAYNNDYTGNYDISYQLSVVIDYSEINFAVDGNGTFTYEPGVSHKINVTVFNADANLFTITYSTSENGTYVSNPQSYTNVKAGQTAGTYGFYDTWFKIERDGFTTIKDHRTICIEPKDAGLSFDSPDDVSKEYDGVAFVNATAFPVSCEDSTAKYTYTYSLIKPDGTEVPYATDANGIFGPSEVGHYKVTVQLKDNSLNYISDPISREFYIRTRKIIIISPTVSKKFDYKVWQLDITKSNSTTYVHNLASGEYFVGKLNTSSTNAGIYQGTDGFVWESNFKIYNALNVDVTRNYELSTIQIIAVISKRDIKAVVTPYEGIYDGQEHGILVDIVEDEDGIKPQLAKRFYKDPDTGTYSTTEYTKKEVGIYTVALKIEAENFETLEINNSAQYNSTITIHGKDASGDIVFLDKMYYNGNEYPTPYYEGDSTGNQIVKFYNGADLAKVTVNGASVDPLNDTPTNAGSYFFTIVVETDGVYKELFFKQSFVILPKEIEKDDLIWEDLVQVYTGEPLEPNAYYLDVNGDKIYASSIAGIPQTAVGEYTVVASISDTNYKLLEPSETFKITKKPILSPVFDEDMLTTIYDNDLVIVDTSGKTYLLAADGKLAMIVPADNNIYEMEGYKVVVSDTDTYVLTDNGMLKFEGFRAILISKDDDGNIFLEDLGGDKKCLHSVGLDPDIQDEGVLQPLLDYQIIVDDNYDVHEYEKDNDGKFVLDDDGNRKPIIENNEQVVREHTITLRILDPSNYIWTNPQTSDDIVYHYEITPLEIPNSDYLISIGLDKKIFEWNEESQTPIETVQIILKATTQVYRTLKKGEDYVVKYVQIDGNNNEIVVENPMDVGIYYVYIDGINNYSFSSHEKKFEIVAKAPDLLTIIDGVPLQFIIAETEVVGSGSSATYMVAIKEDADVIERTLDTRDTYDYYLSHIPTELTMKNFLKQFKNDLAYIRIFKDKDATDPYTEEEMATGFIHTGAVVRLYKEEACINVSDEATCIIFGDVDCDGLIVGTDINIIANVMSGKLKHPTLGDGTNEISKISYIAGMVTRSAEQSSITGIIYNDIANHMSGKQIINSEYGFDPDAL